MAGKVYEAKTTFTCEHEGQHTLVRKGSVVREGHPILTGREELFQLHAPRGVDFEVEQATAAPGELRKVGRPKGGDR